MLVLLTTVQFFLEGQKHVVRLGIDDVTSIDDLLSLLGNTTGKGDAVLQVAETGLATVLVVDEVGGDIVVETAFLENLPVSRQLWFSEDKLIGRYRGVDVVDLCAGSHLPVDDTDHLGCVLAEFGIVGIAHHSLCIDTVQTICNDTDIVVGQSGDTFVIVLHKLTCLDTFRLLVVVEVGLVEFHQ